MNNSFDRMFTLMIPGSIFVLVIFAIAYSIYESNQFYNECQKTNSKFECMKMIQQMNLESERIRRGVVVVEK